ncbi:Coatomer subunit gamma-2 [Halotydeus destructor]|nr:Coatomer subunit gamma-2 [Halotydeus destructor]
MYKKEKKDEEEAGGNPFAKVQKTTALQEARVFNENPVNPRKCALILTKILYILNHGDQLSTQEATDCFFNMTKLFQCKDTTLRRLVYLGIKELSKVAENVYVVTSSLTQDMNSKEDQFRPAAMRALIQITDATTFQGIERYMKQAIVDKNSVISSAALVSSLHLSKSLPEGIKRWGNEALEACNSDNMMVQYHALGLLYHIRRNDRLAVSKLVTKYVRSGLKSPYATCMLVRIAAKLIEEEGAGTDSPYYDFIESCLRHKSEMVAYEAANAIVNLNCTSQRELSPAVSVLQLFLGSAKPTLRFAAVRTLNKVAISHPAAVTACNVDLENLITDSNRSIATLAITTLLKTGSETSVERLMKQIGTFMSEISDEFKVVVVSATRQLCAKFPKKHNVMMSFLSNMLREEGGFEYKRSIVDTIINIIEDNPESKEAGLSYLCEFIEDCEHTDLAVRILHLLGREGPRTSRPAKYIRYIYNRLILENASVRAAAVSSLAKFGAHCEDLLDNICVLLERSCLDSDDEVRDRSVYYLLVLKAKQRNIYNNCILNPLQVSLVGLEKALQQYLSLEQTEVAFDMKSVPIASVPVPSMNDRKLNQNNESETEYVVQCVKHVFKRHLVVQFELANTCNDQILENVQVSFTPPEGYQQILTIPCPQLNYNVRGVAYAALELPETQDGDFSLLLGSFESLMLKYIVKDCDPNTGEVLDGEVGYDDEYALEDVDIGMGDFVQKVVKANFAVSWDELGEENEIEETYSLSSFKSIEEATSNIINFMGLQPAERSDKVPESKAGGGAHSHTILLAGIFMGDHELLVKVRLALTSNLDAGVTAKFSVRCTDAEVGQFIASAVV